MSIDHFFEPWNQLSRMPLYPLSYAERTRIQSTLLLLDWCLQIPWPVVIIIIFSCLISTVCGLALGWSRRLYVRSFVHLAVLASPGGVLVYHYTQRIQIHSVVFDDRGGQHTQPVTDRRNTASRKAICLLARWMSQGTVIERPLDPIWIWRMCEETDIASNKSIIAHD